MLPGVFMRIYVISHETRSFRIYRVSRHTGYPAAKTALGQD